MRIHLVNPSDVAFGVGVITPRWLYVLAAATPEQYGSPVIVDETLESMHPEQIQSGDVIGIDILDHIVLGHAQTCSIRESC